MNLVTVNQIKNSTSISKQIDESIIENYIPIAQRFHIKPVIGNDLYDSIIDKIKNNELSGVYKTLYDDYIVPSVTYYTLYEGAPFFWIRTENKGLTIKYSDNSETISIDQFNIYRQSFEDNAIMYLNDLKDYLEENREHFEELDNKSQGDDYNWKDTNSSGLFIGF